VGRFSAVRRRYIWKIVQQGPTEIGYAYFRARRRRRNRGDDEPLLSESDQLALSGFFDASDAALAENQRLVDSYLESETFAPSAVTWFLPFFHHVYFGGTHTLLRFAEHFARVHGVATHFHCYDVGPAPVKEMAAKVAAAFPALAGASFTSTLVPVNQLPPCDAAIATLWTSAYPLLHMRQARAKFYFVQDNEPQFYAAGAASGLAEETYRFGLPGIVNTPGLRDVYTAYGNAAVAFVPAVDLARYRPPDQPRDPAAPIRIFFYGRPKTSRNAFGLGIAALQKLKAAYGDRVEILCAGEDWNPGQFGLHGKIRNLGVLGSLDEVAVLYRSCDIGLVFMHTKHPSYQPFEFMASGMATVSNINPATEWLLRDGENCLLTPPLPTPITERLGRLVDDAELRARIVAAGLAEVRRYRWEEQIERVWSAICRPREGFAPGTSDVAGSLEPVDETRVRSSNRDQLLERRDQRAE
jgi:glycosyltransferase involved in cell wall biosynthesis